MSKSDYTTVHFIQVQSKPTSKEAVMHEILFFAIDLKPVPHACKKKYEY
jgi:hypothetical protein